jgi:peptidylprolyl isomerase
MTKNIFVFLILAVCLVSAGWFFIGKDKVVSTEDGKDLLQGTLSGDLGIPSESEESEDSMGTMITLDNGLKIQDLVIGAGPGITSGYLASVHYEGRLENGQKFDSSYDRGKAFLFLLGAGKVIQGWELGVPGMKVGGKRKLIIPSELAYGEEGAGGVIPPNAILIFEVELIDMRKGQ